VVALGAPTSVTSHRRFARRTTQRNLDATVATTTFSPLHLAPDGRAMLSCSCVIPDGWVQVPVPEEAYDFDNPTVFLPLLVCVAPYGAVVFSIAARPAFDDGTVQDWAEHLAAQNKLEIERMREARVNRMPCILVDATMPSDAGLMRSRSVFLEDGRRLFNIGTLAPDVIWASVEADFDRLLGSFALDDVQGITAAPLRLMTSDPSVDLSAAALAPKAPKASEAPDQASEGSVDPANAQPADPAPPDDLPLPSDRPTQAVDVALADDASSLDPHHPINARMRDSGVGIVPRVTMVVTRSKFASIGAAAVDAVFRVPFGWHVIDDGRRTLVFDPDGSVQINLDLRAATPDALLSHIGSALAQDNPDAQFLTFELLDSPCLAVRDLVIDGARLDQAYLLRPSHRDGLTLVCRVTADRENMTRAMNTAEVILTSLQGPMPPDPEFAGQPDWWRTAVLHERDGRLEEAEQIILQSVDHIGAYSSVAHLYEQRSARLVRAGQGDAAAAARERAIHWLYVYASSATSGGEGAALSLERDQRIAALGGEVPAR